MTLVTRRILLICLSFSLVLGFSQSQAAESTSLFNGKDLSGWRTSGRKPNNWKVGKAAVAPTDAAKLVVEPSGTELVGDANCPNLVSEAAFGDCVLDLEFMIPKDSNSGVKLQRIYEIQILDNAGKETLGKGDCGAIYKERAPNVNACKAPGEWQTLHIEFRAPRFDASGTKTADARFIKVTLNDKTLHENVSVPHGTNVGPDVKEFPRGEILLQGDHGPVAFRNIRITPLD